MQFVVNWDLLQPSDATTTSPLNLKPKAEKKLAGKVDVTRQVSLNEGESEEVCVDVDAKGNVVQVAGTPPDCPGLSAPFGPKEALLGQVDLTGATPEGIPLKWTDTTGASTPVPVTLADGVTVKMVNVTENPTLGDTEDWDMYNFSEDAHPIHLHLVRFEVVGREAIDGGPSIVGNAPQRARGQRDDAAVRRFRRTVASTSNGEKAVLRGGLLSSGSQRRRRTSVRLPLDAARV
jgi:hypothetical protein